MPGLPAAGVGRREEREADLPGHRDPARAGCGPGRGCGVARARRRRPVDAEAVAGPGGAGAPGRGRRPPDRARPEVRPGTAEYLSRHLLSVLTPDRADRYDEDALDRRHLSVVTDQTGMVLVSGQLDQFTGLKLATVLDHVVETDRAAGSADGGDVDVRTRGQRRVDALGVMADAAAEFLGLGAAATGPTTGGRVRDRAGDPAADRAGGPAVVVVTTPEQLAGTEGAGAAVTTDGDLVDRRRADPDRVRRRHRPRRPRQGGSGAGDGHDRPARHRRPADRPGRPRPRLRLAGLHHPAVAVRGAPRDLVVPRRTHHPRQPRPALPPPPHARSTPNPTHRPRTPG